MEFILYKRSKADMHLHYVEAVLSRNVLPTNAVVLANVEAATASEAVYNFLSRNKSFVYVILNDRYDWVRHHWLVTYEQARIVPQTDGLTDQDLLENLFDALERYEQVEKLHPEVIAAYKAIWRRKTGR